MHSRFDEQADETAEQELARRLQHSVATQSSASYSPCSSLNAASIVKTDFETHDQCYVFDLTASGDSQVVAAALSSHAIKLYNTQGSGGLTYVGDLTGHAGVVSEISFAGEDNPHGLYSSSEDGTVKGWDSRTGQEVQRYT